MGSDANEWEVRSNGWELTLTALAPPHPNCPTSYGRQQRQPQGQDGTKQLQGAACLRTVYLGQFSAPSRTALGAPALLVSIRSGVG